MRQIAIFLSFCVMVGCASSETEDSSNVNQDRIYQLHSVDYDTEKGEFKWTASFTLGGPTGTTLELVSGSSVTINDQTMEKLTTGVSGTFYIKEEKAKFSAKPHEFQWKDSNGKEFNNSITLNTVAFPEDLSTSFSKATGITVTWVGDEIAADDDWVSLEVTDNSDDELAIGRLNEQGATSITISPKDLSDLATGEIELQLTRYSGWMDLKEATSVGGGIGYNYYSTKKTATLAE